MNKKFKYILIGLAVVIIAGFGLYYLNMPLSAELYAVSATDAQLYFIEQGYVASDEKIEVYSLAQGEVISVFVEENQQVKKGDVLCVIDSSGLLVQKAIIENEIRGYTGQTLNLDLAESQEKDAQRLNLDSLQGEYNALLAQEGDILASKEEQLRLQNIVIAQSRRELDYAERELEKAEVLYSEGIMPQGDFEQYQNSLSDAQTALERNLKQLDIIESGEIGTSDEYINSLKASLGAQIDSINIHLNRSYTSGMKQYYSALVSMAQSQIELIDKQIEDCVVRAPASGEIVSLAVKNTNMVSSQAPVAVISEEKGKEVEVYVSTKDLGDVAVGNIVRLTFKRQSGDIDFPGEVIRIDGEATVKLSALGVEERRVRVVVAPDEPETIDLKSGYDVDVRFTTYYEENALTAPKTAFYKKDGKDYVFLAVNGKLQETEVELGVELRTEYIINAGLSDGALVVKDVDMEGLREGVNVKID